MTLQMPSEMNATRLWPMMPSALAGAGPSAAARRCKDRYQYLGARFVHPGYHTGWSELFHPLGVVQVPGPDEPTILHQMILQAVSGPCISY